MQSKVTGLSAMIAWHVIYIILFITILYVRNKITKIVIRNIILKLSSTRK